MIDQIIVIPLDKTRLDRFMELASITSTNLDDDAIVFPELYESYSQLYS